MGQPTYSLQTDNVRQVADDVLACSNRIRDLILEMDGNLKQYLSQWIGNDQTEYEAYKAKWLNLITEMIDILNKASSGLHSMVNNVKSTENRIRGTFQ